MSNVTSEIAKEETINEKVRPAMPEANETAAEIAELLKKKIASGYTAVYMNTLGKEVGFREIGANEQKSLSRVMIGNENRKDIIYDTQCATINTAALLDGFDIYQCTELERLKVLIALYQANMFNNDVQFTCKECGSENKFKLNFESVIRKLDEIDIMPKDFKYESKNFTYEFKCAYPSVKLVSKFHKQYFARHKNTSKRDVKVNDQMSNMEYIDLFIAGLKIADNGGNVIKDIDFKRFKPEDIETILGVLPQDVLYSDNGVLQFITKEFLQKMNDSFDKHKCTHCGAIQEEENSNQVESFL